MQILGFGYQPVKSSRQLACPYVSHYFRPLATTANHHDEPPQSQPRIPMNRELAPSPFHLLAILFRGWTVSSLQGLLLGHVPTCFCTAVQFAARAVVQPSLLVGPNSDIGPGDTVFFGGECQEILQGPPMQRRKKNNNRNQQKDNNGEK
jgi:hypothetical protein